MITNDDGSMTLTAEDLKNMGYTAPTKTGGTTDLGLSTEGLYRSTTQPTRTYTGAQVPSATSGGYTGGTAAGTAAYGGQQPPNLSGSYTQPSTTTSGGGGGDMVSGIFEDVSKVIQNMLQVATTSSSEKVKEHTQHLFDQYYNLYSVMQQATIKNMDFKEMMDKYAMGLDQEKTRMAQTGLQENLLTSGTSRYQAEVGFAQSQQDRSQQQKFLNALSSGIAKGLARRTPTPQLGPSQPAPARPINQPVQPAYSTTPTIAGGR